LVARRRRTARKAEAYITSYRFPSHISPRVSRHVPLLDEAGWPLVEQGLREWFVCCAWRGRTVLGMPSRLVDEAWHEFILDSVSYTRFCNVAFGGYLHHTLDERLGATGPLGISGLQLSASRSRAPYAVAGGWACAGFSGGLEGGAGHHHNGGGCSGSGCSVSGCSGGGSGGGCGGGGCGGGS
jgi:hypothetical protein